MTGLGALLVPPCLEAPEGAEQGVGSSSEPVLLP